MLDRYITTKHVTHTETRIDWREIRSDLSHWALDRITDARCALATVIHTGWRFCGQVSRQAQAIGFAVSAGLFVAGIAYQAAIGGAA